MGFGTPFQAALEFFRRKLDLPTERWDDIERSANDRAFVVAGAMKADLLNDLHGAVATAMSGAGLAQFRKDFAATVAQHGWTGWTGEGSAKGVAWRTRVIYQTNMATAYAAGRYRQMTDPGYLALNPWWEYVHADMVEHPRPLHQAWNGLCLRHDHPFWQTHYAPNGWGCRCQVRARRAPPPGAATEPPKGWDTVSPTTGAPLGIDRGWDYAPGANATTPLREMVDQKLVRMDAPVGAAMWQALKPALQAERVASWKTWVREVMDHGMSRNQMQTAGVMDRRTIEFLAGRQLAPVSAEIAVEDRLLVGKKAERHAQAGDALTQLEWLNLPQALELAEVYFDVDLGTLIYVLPATDADRSIKLAVVVNFVTARPKRTVNSVRSAFKINVQALQDARRYVPIRA